MSRILCRHVFSTRRIAHVLGVLGLSAVSVAACGEQRSGSFGGSNIVGFEQDASTDAAPCPLSCSLDGRAVLRSCSGETVETCPAELACGAGRCQEPCAAAAADQSSNGCDFYLQPPRFRKSIADQGCYAAYVVNTSNVPVDVAIELDGARLDLSKALFTMVPGEATLVPHVGPIDVGEAAVVFLSDLDPSSPSQGTNGATRCPEGVVPATYKDALPDGSGFGSAFRLETTAPVNLSAIYPFGGASSFAPTATLILPVPSWGTEHMLVNAWSRWTSPLAEGKGWPGLQIVAAEDDTEITIRPTHSIEDGADFIGAPAKLPVTYRLSRGQVLQLLQAEELTGSIMTSTKPTSTFGGHESLQVPASRNIADIAQQQIPPFKQWGSEYVAVGYRPRLDDEREPVPYRIVAARDGTRLDYDPVVPVGAPIAMSAGEVVTFHGRIGEPFVVRTQDTEHPIYLAAYMTGGNRPGPDDPLPNWDAKGRGDPEYVNVIPAGQYLSSYSFFADPTYDETSLVIVRARNGDKFEDVWLECAGNLPDFKPIGTRGQYEYTRVDLIRNGGPGQAFGSSVCKSGLQRMKSEGPFTATLWGWSSYASYAYPGGMAQRTLSDAPLAPVN